jgi:2-dehydropantoate 2-reductase
MGGSYGAMLALSGHEVHLVDTDTAHVQAIARNGLLVDGARGEHRVRLPAAAAPDPGQAELAVLFTDSNATAAAAGTVGDALAPDGCAITFQNGIGNVETLQATLGRERVLGGSSMCSAAARGPGHVSLTHLGPTAVGETDGSRSTRVEAITAMLVGAGFETHIDDDIMAKIWSKFVLNCAVNALCATTGLRAGEMARLPELDALQDHVVDEALAVTEAKGIRLPDPDMRASIKAQCRQKFNQPSMLQHVEAGRRTEIDALNAALVREAAALGIPTPYNEAVTALLKGRELHQRQRRLEPELDHGAWEDALTRGEDPYPGGWVPRGPR